MMTRDATPGTRSQDDESAVPWLEIPAVSVTCIEFPGLIRDFDNVARSFGGKSELEAVCSVNFPLLPLGY